MRKGLMFEGFWALCWAGFFVSWLFALLEFVVLLSACFEPCSYLQSYLMYNHLGLGVFGSLFTQLFDPPLLGSRLFMTSRRVPDCYPTLQTVSVPDSRPFGTG
jgi:hypothetical protein